LACNLATPLALVVSPKLGLRHNTFLAQEAQDWAKESNQDLVFLLLDFEKAFDRIEWSFLFEALAKLGFCPQWIKWVSSLYGSASSAIKLNGVEGSTFPLARSVRQGCPLSPYLFILVTDVLGHMLDDPRFEVEGLALSGGGKITDQTFADDTALYLQPTVIATFSSIYLCTYVSSCFLL
jgi:hypothetical protein